LSTNANIEASANVSIFDDLEVNVVGNAIFQGRAQITAEGILFARPSRVKLADGAINAQGLVYVEGLLFGREWEEIPSETDIWTEQAIESDIWTEKAIGENTWQRLV
jgi:hypothetical protein